MSFRSHDVPESFYYPDSFMVDLASIMMIIIMTITIIIMIIIVMIIIINTSLITCCTKSLQI